MPKTRIRSLAIVLAFSLALPCLVIVTKSAFSTNFLRFTDVFKLLTKIHILFTVGFVGKSCVKVVKILFPKNGKFLLFTALLGVIFSNFGKKLVFKLFGCQSYSLI